MTRLLGTVALFACALVSAVVAHAQGLTVTGLSMNGKRVDSVAGVRVRAPGASAAQARALVLKEPIAAGTDLALPRGAQVELTSANGNRITLHPGARFVAGNVTPNGESHQPLSGRLDFEVRKALDFFNIEYERITAAVKGTAYTVDIDPQSSLTLSVREGVVEVERPVQVRVSDAKGRGGADPEEGDAGGFLLAEDLAAGQSKTYRLNVEEYFAEFRNFGEADAYFQKALAVAERSGSARRIVRAVLNVMELNWKTSRYGASLALEARCLELAASLRDAAVEASCRNAIGLAHYELSDYRKALGYYESALALNRRLFGDSDRRSIAASLNNLGNAHRWLGEFPQALSYYQQSLQMRERLAGGREDLAISLALTNLGWAFDGMDQPRKAIEYYERALAILERVLGGADHLQVVLTLSHLGSALIDVGQAQNALPHLERALAIAERVYAGRDGKYTASALHFIGMAKVELGDYRGALEPLERSLAMRQRLYEGRDHAFVASTLHMIGRAYDGLRDYRTAVGYLEKALAMRERVFGGRDHIQTANTLMRLARNYRLAGEPAKAVESAQRGLAMRERLYGPAHRSVAEAMRNLAAAHQAAGNPAEAARYRQRAAAIDKRGDEK